MEKLTIFALGSAILISGYAIVLGIDTIVQYNPSFYGLMVLCFLVGAGAYKLTVK